MARSLFRTPLAVCDRNRRDVRSEIDPRIGGKFTFTDRRDGQDVEHTGEYLEIDRPRRLVFMFGVPLYASDFAEVAINIDPLPGGGCELTLVQKMKPDYIDYQEPTRRGWGMILDGLAKEIGSA